MQGACSRTDYLKFLISTASPTAHPSIDNVITETLAPRREPAS